MKRGLKEAAASMIDLRVKPYNPKRFYKVTPGRLTETRIIYCIIIIIVKLLS